MSRNKEQGNNPEDRKITLIEGGKNPGEKEVAAVFNIFDHIADESRQHIIQCQKIAEETGLGKDTNSVRLVHDVMVDFWNLYGLYVEED